MEAHFKHNHEGLKISSILGQTLGGRALIFGTSSTAQNLTNVTALLSSDDLILGSSASLSTYKNLHATREGCFVLLSMTANRRLARQLPG
jgi:hypothetical protein